MSGTIPYPEDHDMSQSRRDAAGDHGDHGDHAISAPSRLTAAAAGVALLGGGYAVVKNMENADRAALNRQQVEAFTGLKSKGNNIIVLKSGARYRVSPQFLDGGESDALDNRAGQVPEGKEVVISEALAGDGGSASGWVAFTPPDVDPSDITSKDDRIEHTVYANVDQLIHDGKAEVVEMGSLDSEYTRMEVNEAGQILVDGKVDANAGRSVEIPEGTTEKLGKIGLQIDFK